MSPENGLGSNNFNRLGFVLGFSELGANGPTLSIIGFGLGSTAY
jgi:hypothetical protein